VSNGTDMLGKFVHWFLMPNHTERCATACHELLQQARNDATIISNIIITGNEMSVWLQSCNKTNFPVGSAVTTLAKET
jgi:hypothetical protein